MLKPNNLNIEFSLYLGLLAFFAAVIVFFSYSSHSSLTGGFLWQASGYGQTAVIVFFVLSVYVVRYVVKNEEFKPNYHDIARISRLYLLIIPALLMLTVVCNTIDIFLIPENYQGLWSGELINQYYRYLVTFCMLHSVWGFQLTPPNNGPFWSMSFAFFYYLIFGIYFYLRSTLKKTILLIFIMLVAGPTIILLLPIWLVGGVCYKLHHHHKHPAKKIQYLIFSVPIVGLLCTPIYREYFKYDFSFTTRQVIIGNYIDAAFVFLNLYTAPVVAHLIKKSLIRLQKSIILCGALTFSLYLFHIPLLRLFSAISPFNANTASFLHISFVIGSSLTLILLIAPPCEQYRYTLKNVLKKHLEQIR